MHVRSRLGRTASAPEPDSVVGVERIRHSPTSPRNTDLPLHMQTIAKVGRRRNGRACGPPAPGATDASAHRRT
ncbi:hypothetical protein BLAT2472_80066 [Burkholderia latens]